MSPFKLLIASSLVHTDAVREAFPNRGASAVPAGGLATRARAALGIIPPALRPEREVLSLDWDRPGRVADLSEE